MQLEYKTKEIHTHWTVKSLLSLILSIPFIFIYFWKEDYNIKFPFIVACVILYKYIKIRYSITSLFYTYYEKFIENNCFFLFNILNNQKLNGKTIGIRSEIKLFDKFYNLTIYDNNNKYNAYI